VWRRILPRPSPRKEHGAVDLDDREADDDHLKDPANGKTVTGIAAYGEILKLTETSFVDHQE
jgi:hypothetical protein